LLVFLFGKIMNILNIILFVCSVALVYVLFFFKRKKHPVTEVLVTRSVKPSKRKVYDTTPFTDSQVEYIKRRFALNKVCLPKHRVTQLELTIYLNATFGLNKSVTAYRRVWKNETNKQEN